MRRSLTIPLLLMFPALAWAQAPSPRPASRLEPGLWQKRQAAQQAFDASGGSSGAAYETIQAIDAQYRGFVSALSEAYEKKEVSVIDSRCDAARGDPEAAIFCALIRYRLRGRKAPARFLAALPATPETAAALDDLRQAASQKASAPQIAALPVYSVTDEMYRLMLAGNSVATSRYFYLLHHSGGAWADDAADQLEHYLREHAAELIRNWPVLRKHWNLSDGITWDVDADWWEGTVAHYRRVCSSADPRCREILGLLQKAAHAAGAR